MNASVQISDPPPLTCEQAVRRLWDYLDRQLSATDTAAVDQHLRDCKAKCASHFAFERAFQDMVRAARPTGATSEGLRHRIAALMANDDFPTTDESV